MRPAFRHDPARPTHARAQGPLATPHPQMGPQGRVVARPEGASHEAAEYERRGFLIPPLLRAGPDGAWVQMDGQGAGRFATDPAYRHTLDGASSQHLQACRNRFINYFDRISTALDNLIGQKLQEIRRPQMLSPEFNYASQEIKGALVAIRYDEYIKIPDEAVNFICNSLGSDHPDVAGLSLTIIQWNVLVTDAACRGQ